ncbi:uncharacterized protein J3R85_018047 [Psidium guajava]|nr:uncharacterized protein J3R85_018047 [Psidium guajava]
MLVTSTTLKTPWKKEGKKSGVKERKCRIKFRPANI